MSNVRAQAALISGLIAWLTIGLMVVGPWFGEDETGASRLLYALFLMPLILAFALVSFCLAEESNRTGRVATRVSAAAAAALLVYFFIPWFVNLALALFD
jgi:hypothetical protein